MREEENQVAWLHQRATQQFVAGEPRVASLSTSVVRRRLREAPRPPELRRWAVNRSRNENTRSTHSWSVTNIRFVIDGIDSRGRHKPTANRSSTTRSFTDQLQIGSGSVGVLTRWRK